MNNPHYHRQKNKLLKIRKLIWTLLFGTTVFYAVLGFVLQSQHVFEPSMTPLNEANLYFSLKLGMLALSAGNFWLASFLRKKGWGAPGLGLYQQKGITETDGKEFTKEEKSDLRMAHKLFSVDIVSWALSEAIAIYGFPVFLLFGKISDLLLFVGLAGMGFYIFRPQPIPKRHQPFSSS